MGASMSELAEKEKESWVLPHTLDIEYDLRDEQLKLIENFGSRLQLRYQEREMFGVKYRHFWITDERWILEWGGGDILRPKILVHCNDPHRSGVIEARFQKTREVEERMKQLCGATNYSLALRNCEHAARYVHVGSWLCFQMVGEGILKRQFFEWMSAKTKLINIAPQELQRRDDSLLSKGRESKISKVSKGLEYHLEPIYVDKDDIQIRSKFVSTGCVLDATQKQKYTVLFLGPTGSGKSRAINLLFNQEVAKSKASSRSITKEIHFYNGKVEYLADKFKTCEEDIVMIDTIGRE